MHCIYCTTLHSIHILLRYFLIFSGNFLSLDILHFVSCLLTNFVKMISRKKNEGSYLDVRDADVEHDCDLYDWLDFLPPLFVSFQFLSFECFLLHIELVFWLLIWLQPEINQIFSFNYHCYLLLMYIKDERDKLS